MENDFQDDYKKYDFHGRRTDETIILVLRRHWLILVIRFLPMLLFAIGIIAFNLLIGQAVVSFLLDFDLVFLKLINLFLLMFLWLGIFIIWIDYYLDIWIVTDQRIINIEQLGLFRREVSELEHGKIQDVTSEIKGLVPTLLKYGYIYIQTAGEKERFVFKQIKDPVRVRNIIMRLQKQAVFREKKIEGEILRGKC